MRLEGSYTKGVKKEEFKNQTTSPQQVASTEGFYNTLQAKQLSQVSGLVR